MLKPTAVSRPSELEIALTRDFATRPQRLYDFHTKPDLLRRWMTPPEGWVFESCEIDAQVGGPFRNVFRNLENGQTFEVSGVYTAIDPPRLISHTEVAEGQPGDCVETTTFVEIPGGTRLTNTWRYSTAEACAAAVASGMVEGMSPIYETLAGLAAS